MGSRMTLRGITIEEIFGSANNGSHPVDDELIGVTSDRSIDSFHFGVEVDYFT